MRRIGISRNTHQYAIRSILRRDLQGYAKVAGKVYSIPDSIMRPATTTHLVLNATHIHDWTPNGTYLGRTDRRRKSRGSGHRRPTLDLS